MEQSNMATLGGLSLAVPKQYYEHFKDEIPMPENPEGIIENLPKNYQKKRHQTGFRDTEVANIKMAREIYYGMVEWIDEKLGKVIDALDNSEVGRDTIVIFATDHGEGKGEHGLWGKSTMYDFSAKIPLIVRFPQRWKGNQRRPGACSLVDVVQTILELTGTEAPANWDGDSLLPYLDDPNCDWKDIALSEMYALPYSGATMVRQGKWKYVYHARIDDAHGPEIELFDMETDPKEFRNLAHDSEQKERIELLHAQMVAELGENPDQIEQRARKQNPYHKKLSWWFHQGVNRIPIMLRKLRKLQNSEE